MLNTTPPVTLNTTVSSFRKALDYSTNRLQNRSTDYESRHKGNSNWWRKKLRSEILYDEFTQSEPIQILDFLLNFRRSRDVANIHGGAAKCLFPHFTADNTSYDETINYLLETYATEDNIWCAQNELTHLKERTNDDFHAFDRVIFFESCLCRLLYDQTLITHIGIEKMKETILNQTRIFHEMYPEMTFDNITIFTRNFDATCDPWMEDGT